MLKNLLLLAGLCIFMYNVQAQDQIVKTSGDEIFGKVLRVNALDVVYKKKDNLEGPEYAELKSNILFIKYENGAKDIFTTANTPVVKDMSTICEPVKRKNSVFFEAGGNGIFASINYEGKAFLGKKNNFLAAKIGLGPFAIINVLNMTATYNIGDGMNYFEIGGGLGWFTSNLLFGSEILGSDRYNYFYFTPTIGYRRHSARGFLFRTFITTFAIKETRQIDSGIIGYGSSNYTTQDYYQYYPSLGISVGYAF